MLLDLPHSDKEKREHLVKLSNFNQIGVKNFNLELDNYFILTFIDQVTLRSSSSSNSIWGHNGHDHMEVGFTTTCAISAFTIKVVIKFVTDMRQVGSFLLALQIPNQ